MLLVLSWFSHVLPASLLHSCTGWAVEMPSLLLSRLLRRCVQCRRTSRLNWFLKSEPQRPITPLLCFFVRTLGFTNVKNNIQFAYMYVYNIYLQYHGCMPAVLETGSSSKPLLASIFSPTAGSSCRRQPMIFATKGLLGGRCFWFLVGSLMFSQLLC